MHPCLRIQPLHYTPEGVNALNGILMCFASIHAMTRLSLAEGDDYCSHYRGIQKPSDGPLGVYVIIERMFMDIGRLGFD